MNNYKIVIDAGHGGVDPGSSGNGIIEKDLNLKIANLMYEEFKKSGIPVKIIRSTDETISPEERTKRVLEAFGNDPNVIVISNHINAGGGDGAEVIYALRNTSKLSNLILNELEKAGQNVRKAYQRRLPSDPSKDYYFMQRDTGKTESITVEYGFLDSTKDDVSQLKNDYPKYVNAVVKAVEEYIGLNTSEVYKVVSGDSLWSIAKKFGITVEELKDYNNLTSNTLSIGQVLKIPTKESGPTGVDIYIVRPGDSLYSISKLYNTTVDELMRLNKLNSTTLSIGQQLVVPKKADVVPPTVDYTLYVVKAGDSLYSISKQYGTSVDKLKDFNDLKSNLLSIGQVLKIPGTNTVTYVVKAGDSLYSISKKYNTTVDELKKNNNIKNDILSIGQVLIIK